MRLFCSPAAALSQRAAWLRLRDELRLEVRAATGGVISKHAVQSASDILRTWDSLPFLATGAASAIGAESAAGAGSVIGAGSAAGAEGVASAGSPAGGARSWLPDPSELTHLQSSLERTKLLERDSLLSLMGRLKVGLCTARANALERDALERDALQRDALERERETSPASSAAIAVLEGKDGLYSILWRGETIGGEPTCAPTAFALSERRLRWLRGVYEMRAAAASQTEACVKSGGESGGEIGGEMAEASYEMGSAVDSIAPASEASDDTSESGSFERALASEASEASESGSFERALFCMLARYDAVCGHHGAGSQAAVPSEVYRALERWGDALWGGVPKGTAIELFSSPLNHRFDI